MNKIAAIIVLLVFFVSPLHAQSAKELFQQGYELYISGQYGQALDYYSQAASLSPDSANAYLWRAKCHAKLGNRKEAIWNLKKALQLDPKLWGAKYLLASLRRGVPERLPSRGNVSLEFQDLDVRQAIFALARETGTNLVPGGGLSGKITLSLNDVSTGEALEAVLEAARAKVVQEGNLFKVFPVAEEYESVETPEGNIAKTYRIDYVSPASVVESLKALLPAAEMVATVKDTNYIIIQGSKATIQKANAIIRNIDSPPKQVMVEARVIELRSSDISNLGMDIKASRSSDPNDAVQTRGQAGKAGDSGAQGFYAQILSTNVEAYLSALSTQTQYNLVASPRITTLSDRTATILIGSKYGYKTAIITDTSTTQQIQFLEVGTSLSITPSVTKDGFIKMKVAPKVSEGQVVNDLPQENTTETANEVMVRDGQTIVIGGLIKDKQVQTDTGVPVIMNIPFLGALFRKTNINTEKSELLVFITPHILTPETLTEMNKEAAEQQKRSDQQKARLIH
jgi:type II secretory pathway component GspD/PulD (secretin)